jgi:Skp family chaperone for outer membrane proteins
MFKKIFCLSALLAITAVQLADVKEVKKTAIAAKLAVVDFQKIINFDVPEESSSLEWRDLMADLEKKLKPRITKLQDKQAKLQKRAQETQGKMDDDINAELMKMQNEIEIDAKAYQTYSQKALGEVQNQFGEKVRLVVQAVAQEQGWTHVLPGPLLYVLESCDITNDVVDRLNKNYRTEQRAKKFGKAEKAE